MVGRTVLYFYLKQDKERTRYNLRSRNKLLSETPLVKTKKTLGDRSFQVVAPQLMEYITL